MLTLTPLPIRDEVRRWYGTEDGSLPSTYLVIDTETSGLDPKVDVVTQVAVRFVREGEVVSTVERTLDWSQDSRADMATILRRMAYVRGQMTRDIYGDQTGISYDFDLDRLKQGDPPGAVLSWLKGHVFAESRRDYVVVGHNIFFDWKMLAATFSRFLYWDDFSIPENRCVDTHGFVRAAFSRPQVLPTAKETATEYWRRAAASKRELDRVPNCKLASCVEHLGIVGVDSARMHTHASEDVVATQQLYDLCRAAIAPSPKRPGSAFC